MGCKRLHEYFYAEGCSVWLFVARGGCFEGYKSYGCLPYRKVSVRCQVFYCKLLNFVV